MGNVNYKSLILGILIGAVVLGAILYFTGLLAPHAAVQEVQQVQQVKQPSPPSSSSPCVDEKQHKINVTTLPSDPAVDSEFVVLCKNDTLTWVKGGKAMSFTVDFTSGTPLMDTHGVDKSHFSDSPGDGSGIAKDLNLQPNNFAYFKYTVTVKDSAGGSHINDPGVIIVK